MQCVCRVVLSALLMTSVAGCGSLLQRTPQAGEVSKDPALAYVDSTQYFADRTASVSMRAAFQPQASLMHQGYRFQFRTISAQLAFLSSVSVIAGGKRLFVEAGQRVLPSQQGITLALSLEESQFIASAPSALLQFKYNNQSYMMTIELHQLAAFVP